jgi:hypothetical protein
MKLKTIIRIDGKFTAAIGDDDDMSHDSAAAHALMQAMGELEAHHRGWHQEIRGRASELMRTWGFGGLP